MPLNRSWWPGWVGHTGGLLRAFFVLLRRNTGFLAGAALAIYVGWHLLHGERGLVSRARLEGEIALKKARLDELEILRARLEKDIFLLQDEHPDPELLGEYLLKSLLCAPPHGWMVLVPEGGSVPPGEDEQP
jgi:hypothetical protein